MELIRSLAAAFVVSAVPTFILLIFAARKVEIKQLDAMVAFAAGALLADASHHISSSNIVYSVSLFFIVDMFLCRNGHSEGILAIIGDAIHNFTDGIAIAASMGDPTRGYRTVMAITLHEIPHQFADFAVLFRSGYSIKAILATQLLTSLACFLGVLVGCVGKKVDEAALEDFTSGGFLYLSLATLLPSVRDSKKNSLIIVGFFILGIALIRLN